MKSIRKVLGIVLLLAAVTAAALGTVSAQELSVTDIAEVEAPDGSMISGSGDKASDDTRSAAGSTASGNLDGVLPEIPEEMQSVSGTLQPGGLAEYASASRMRRYTAVPYAGSYGAQLSGLSREVYNNLKSTYVDQRRTGTMEMALSPVIGVMLEYTYDAAGKVSLKYDSSAAYQEVRIALEYACQAAMDAFLYDYPEVFWTNAFSYRAPITYTKMGSGYYGRITKLTMIPKEYYAGAGNETAAFYREVDAAVSLIKTRITGTGNRQYNTIKAIHDFICDYAVYQDNTYAHSAGGFFLHGGKVVCEGYAKAFKILCGRFGYESAVVVGNAGGPHMWNYVLMDNGCWYLVDATWDDQENYTYQTYFLAGSSTTGWMSDASGRALTIGEERLLYSNFSSAAYTEAFSFPRLNGSRYAAGTAVHSHTYQTVQEKAATCTQEGYAVYECACGDQVRERTDKLGHCYKELTYVYRGDATCLNDGTKTRYCDRGCGTALYTVKAEGTKLAPTMSINAGSLKLQKKQVTKKLEVTGLGKGDYVKSWHTSNKKIVKVKGSADGKCTIEAGKKTGSARITVVLASGLSKTVKVQVQERPVATAKITGVARQLRLGVRQTCTIKPLLQPFTTKEKARFISSNKKVAVVSKKGRITAKKKGRTIITVKAGKKTVKCRVIVK